MQEIKKQGRKYFNVFFNYRYHIDYSGSPVGEPEKEKKETFNNEGP